VRPEHGSRSTGDDGPMVSLTPSPAQLELDAALRELLDAECPMGRVRTAQALGFDADLWSAVDAAAGPPSPPSDGLRRAGAGAGSTAAG